jgi:two-component system LytT family response regulator
VVTTSRGAIVLAVREIDWIEAADNYARIWTGTHSYLLREPLHEIEQRVRECGFVRAHRRALVRLDAVRALSITSAGSPVAVLNSGTRVPISRRRRATFAAAVKTRR